MIEFKNIEKKFGGITALRGISFKIEENDIFGFVGPAGSGKSTAIKILCGLISPTCGTLTVEGMDILKKPNKIKSILGYIPDIEGDYDNLKVIEYMNFFSSAYGIQGGKRDGKCCEILGMLELCDSSEKYIEELSRNQRKRLCIARALINDPKLLIIDEPFSGLSLKNREKFSELLRQLNSLGITIVITAHTIQEAASLCGSIAAFEEGKVMMVGSILEIEKKMQSKNPIVMRVVKGQDIAIKVLKEDKNVKNLIISENEEILIHFDGGSDEEGKLLERVVLEGALVTSFSRKSRGIESVF